LSREFFFFQKAVFSLIHPQSEKSIVILRLKLLFLKGFGSQRVKIPQIIQNSLTSQIPHFSA